MPEVCVSGFRITQLTTSLTELNERNSGAGAGWGNQSGSAARYSGVDGLQVQLLPLTSESLD